MKHNPTDVNAPLPSTRIVPPHLLAELRAVLVQFPRVRVALLFGSRATGRDRPGSDVDLAVLGPDEDRFALAGVLADALGADVDLVALDAVNIPLLEEILRDSVVVHEGTPGAAALWRSRVLVDLELDRRWYHRLRDAWLARVAKDGLTW